jgi:2-phospho-L-lactate transferase/gluconeogenesis factor (CofD/UPF0052 family)
MAWRSISSAVLRRLFEYRFDRGEGLGGHSFGDLFLTAVSELTGHSDLAIAEPAELLRVNGSVVPVTLSDSRLCAELEEPRDHPGRAAHRHWSRGHDWQDRARFPGSSRRL